MLDLSEESLEENIEICVEYFKKMNALDMMIEIELELLVEKKMVLTTLMLIMLYFIHNQKKFVMHMKN